MFLEFIVLKKFIKMLTHFSIIFLILNFFVLLNGCGYKTPNTTLKGSYHNSYPLSHDHTKNKEATT